MWAAEVSPKGWLRVGAMPSSNLEPPGGCETALSVPLSFPRICLVLQGSAPQRYLSSSLVGISVSLDRKQIANICTRSRPEVLNPLVYHVLMMTGLKRDYCEETFWWPEIAEILLCSADLQTVQMILLYRVTYNGHASALCWGVLAGWAAVEKVTFQVLQLCIELPWGWGSKSFTLACKNLPRVFIISSTWSSSWWQATDFGWSVCYCAHACVISLFFTCCPSPLFSFHDSVSSFSFVPSLLRKKSNGPFPSLAYEFILISPS